MTMEELLRYAAGNKASDIHITPGIPPVIRRNGILERIGPDNVSASDTEAYVKEILQKEQVPVLKDRGEVDFSFSVKGVGRFRANVYRQRGTFGISMRMVAQTVPTLMELGVPDIVSRMCKKTKGLILVAGPTGSGKSTTLAAMVDRINEERNCHIITLEDPIEYLHRHKNSIITQREIGSDTLSYSAALRSALREDPEVILVGDMRDVDTMAVAIGAAETGHLVLSALPTVGASNTIDRVIDVFPPQQQQQIRVQLATVLQGVISQQLLTKKTRDGRIAAFEVMTALPGIKSLIKEEKTYKIDSMMHTGSKNDMQTMDDSLINLYKNGWISYEDALNYALDQENINRFLGN